MSFDIVIRDTRQPDIPQINAALNSVVAERVYLALVTAVPLKSSEEFISTCLGRGYPNVVAETSDAIVGWCDISAREPAEYSHVGRLGMGIVDGYRGAGIGLRLMETAIERARSYGFEKIELDVYHDNQRAQSLYERMGFELEGIRKRIRKIDGIYQDSVLMGLFLQQTSVKV